MVQQAVNNAQIALFFFLILSNTEEKSASLSYAKKITFYNKRQFVILSVNYRFFTPYFLKENTCQM